MILKTSQYADGVGYLYRAAFYMAQGQRSLALSFVKTAEDKLGEKVSVPSEGNDRFIAEKILDSYRRFLLLL